MSTNDLLYAEKTQVVISCRQFVPRVMQLSVVEKMVGFQDWQLALATAKD